MTTAFRMPASVGFRLWIPRLMLCTAAALALVLGNVQPAKGDGAPEAAKAAPDLSTPIRAATAFMKAVIAGDMDTVHQAAIGTEAEFAMVKDTSDFVLASKRLQKALLRKFPDAKVPEMPDPSANLEKNNNEKIEGNSAWIVSKTNPNEKHPMKLLKDGANWKMDLSEMAKDEDAARNLKLFKAQKAVFNKVAEEVESGKYKTFAEAMAAIQQASVE